MKGRCPLDIGDYVWYSENVEHFSFEICHLSDGRFLISRSLKFRDFQVIEHEGLDYALTSH
jgi:hypothetical protein